MLGKLIYQRRQALSMSVYDLSGEMAGTPTPSFISRIELGKATPNPKLAARMSDALQLPREVFLNACGHASDRQRNAALDELRELVTDTVPQVVAVPVMDLTGLIDADGLRRQRMLKVKEDVFAIDLTGRANNPFVGEVIASRDRKPEDGQGVVAIVDAEVGAWTYRRLTKPSTTFIENGAGDKRTKGYEILGVIIRVAVEHDFS